ncbi:hypothetical protein DXG03_007814 [Asterophora parasitica]|uniref:Protein BFR2 n=1 Tax=Asterophora parasitica TaxID=117018 RepID=A0A9P7GIG5_9AGAR|nr:hypothetical protein DXG03_007814 [Asterophora parasitica]
MVAADLDLEDVHGRDVDAEEGLDTNAAAREHYFAVGPSSLRKQHDSVSDPKYEGVRTSRKQLVEESGEEEDTDSGGEGSGSGSEDEDEDMGGHDVQASSGAEEAEASDEDGGSLDSGEEEVKANEPQPRREKSRSIEDDEPADDLSATLRKKREEDKKKGKAVSRQIAGILWLFNYARIRMQKSVAAANRLPPPLDVKEYMKVAECQESVDAMLKEATALSEEIFQLQEYLLTTNDSITPPPRKRRKLADEDTLVNYDQWLQDASHDASALEEAYHPHLVQTLAKWSSKIQAVAPSVLLPSNRGAFSKGSQRTKTALQLIDEILGDTSKILARTQVRRSKGVRIGQSATPDEEEPEQDPNIFDDTDFYQQLLRDIIDARGNASGGADDWLVAQKQRKAKKKVDTKASKGRKLRYETHEKLQNFMVPVPTIGGWHEEQIDELFASLLGKGFEVTGQGTEDAVDGEALRLEEVRLGEALKGGFRVFG